MAIFSKQNQAGNPQNVPPGRASRVPSPRYRKRVHKLVYSIYFRIIFSAILIFLLFMTAALIAFQSEQRKKASLDFEKTIPDAEILLPTPEENPTINWETYTNEEFGFSFKYPPDWEIYDRLDSENQSLQVLKTGLTGTTLDWTDGAALIVTLTDSANIDLTKELTVPKEVVDELGAQVFNFNDWQGYMWESNIDDPINYGEAIIATKSSSEGKIFKIGWSQINSNNDLTAEKYLFPILSTFQFLEE